MHFFLRNSLGIVKGCYGNYKVSETQTPSVLLLCHSSDVALVHMI